MASKTLGELLLGFGAFTKALFIPHAQFKGTADTDGTTAALKDTELAVFADDYFNDDYWLYITSGAAIGNIRNIADFAQTGGIITPDINFSAAPLTDSKYQIWKCHSQDAIDAINNALVSIYPKLYRKIVFESLGMDDLTSNAASGQKDVVVSDESLFFVGQKLTISDDDGSEDCTIASITAGTHTLAMEDNLANAYDITKNAKVTAKSGKYFNLGATIGNARVTGVFLRADTTSRRKPFTEWQVIVSNAGARQIYFPTAVSVDNQSWIIEAMGRLESVSDPGDTVTIDDERVKLLYAEAAYHFFDRQATNISAGDVRRLRAIALKYKDQVNVDFKHLWMVLPRERMSLKTDSDYD